MLIRQRVNGLGQECKFPNLDSLLTRSGGKKSSADTDNITKIYREAAEDELANRNTAQAIHLLEEALKMRPGDQEILGSLLKLLVGQKKLKEISRLCIRLIMSSPRRPRLRRADWDESAIPWISSMTN